MTSVSYGADMLVLAQAPVPLGGSSSGALATAALVGGLIVLGVVLTLSGILLSNRQKARRSFLEVLRTEQREERLARERQVRERAAAMLSALQTVIDAEVVGLQPREESKLVELRLAAQAAFDAFVYVAPADLTHAAERFWIAYGAARESRTPSSAQPLSQYFQVRYDFANAVRTRYDRDPSAE
jgi:hypothetical protein